MNSREVNNEILSDNITNERLIALLKTGKYDPNVNIQGRNALHVMMKIPNGWRAERATFLLEHGVNINSKEPEWGNTPIQVFIANELTETVMHVINEAQRLNIRIDFNLKDKQNKTPLILAIKTMNEKLSLFILSHAIKQKDFDINATDQDGMTALHYACALGMHTVVQALIENRADLAKENTKKRTPIDCTALDGKTVAEILKSVSIDPDRDENAVVNSVHDKNWQDIVIFTENGVSPISNLPSIKSSKEVIERLIQNYHVLNSTYLFVMATEKPQNPLQALRENKLSQTEKNNLLLQFEKMTGKTYVEKAIAGQRLVRNILIENGCDYSWLLRQLASNGSDQLNPLLNSTTIKQHINKAGEPSLKTALHQAAGGGFTDSCEQLIKAGAEINCVDKDGNTPLMLAYLKHKFDVVIFLAKNGADLSIKNKTGKNIFGLITDDNNHAFSRQLSEIISQKNTGVEPSIAIPRP